MIGLIANEYLCLKIVHKLINFHYDRFNVDIKTGPILQPLDDTNLHLSVRPHENAIVRNSMIHQGWGPEERHGGCPIGYGQAFEMLILAESDQFKVWFIFNTV